MRIEDLSGHARHQEDQAERAYEMAAAAESRVEAERADAELRLLELQRMRPLWRKVIDRPTDDEIRQATVVEIFDRQAQRAAERTAEANGRLRQTTAGRVGEELLPSLMKDAVSDNWIMFRGYWNRRGEIDHVLLGPKGLWAIEVKNQRIELDAEGDRWMKRRLDADGNPGEPEPATDNSGRSWGRQVSQPASVLARRLERRNHSVPVRTAVFLANARARIGRCTDPGVDAVVVGVDALVDEINARAHRLDEQEREAIAGLVRSHHHDEVERRDRRRHLREVDRQPSAH